MRLDLSNETFSIGINSKFSPYTWCELNETTRSNPMTCGIEGELLLTLQEYFNFSFMFREIQNNYGFQQKDGSWTGMIGDLAKNKIDLGLGGTVLLYKRRQVVKYLYPHFYDIFTFATPPPEVESNWDMLFEPFQDTVWLCLLVSFLLLFPLQRYLLFGNSPQVQQSDQHDQQNDHHLFWICLHFLFLQQYPRLQWMNIGMKVFSIFWLIAMFVVAILYSGFLFSMMTIQIDNAIDSLDKLAQACRSKRVIVLANNNTFIMEYINNSNLESIQEIMKSLQLVDDQQHAVKMILSQQEQTNSLNTKWWRWWRWSKPPQYVKVSSGERIHFTRLSLTNKDSVYVPPLNGQSSFFPLLIAIPTSPLFKYHKPFDELISRLVCFGLLQHWRAQMVIEMKQYHADIIHETDVADEITDQSLAKENGQDVQLKLKHFESIFFLYSICIMFDLIMLFLEIFARILINKRLRLWKIHDLFR